MIDHTGDVGKTFNDYQEESSIDFIKVHLDQSHPWTGQTLKDLLLPNDLLVVMIARSGQTIVPQGDTLLQAGDLLVIAARGFEDREQLSLQEVAVERGHRWQGKQLRDLNLPNHTLIILIKRGWIPSFRAETRLFCLVTCWSSHNPALSPPEFGTRIQKQAW